MDIKSTVHLMSKPGNLKAFVDVTLNDEFVIKGLKIMDGEKGVFVAMPSQKINNEYKETFFPITKESREQLIESALEGYEKKLEQREEQANDKEQKKGGRKGKSKQTAAKEQKTDDAPEESEQDLSEEGQDEQVDEGPVMQM